MFKLRQCASMALASTSAIAFAQPELETMLETVVVTAEFRQQSAQDTPIALSALSGDALERRNARDIADASNFSPNVSLSRGAAGFGQMAGVFIRGVGQADPHFAVEPGVGVYVDDVYYGVLTGAVFELLDTDRVEVLRGPQGTLAGKNSIGGAIKLFSQRPGPDTNGYAEVGFGSFDRISARAAVNLPLVDDTLYARVSAAALRRDGYVDRLDYACVTGGTSSGTQRLREDCLLGTEGGQEVITARASILWTPNDRIENTLIVDATDDNSENPASKLIFQSPAWTGADDYVTGPESYTNYETYVSQPTGLPATEAFTLPARTPLDAKGVSNILHADIGDSLRFDSITGYRESVVPFANAIDGSPATVLDQYWRLSHEQFTQEFRLSGETGIAEWTVGMFLYDADGISEGRVNLPGGVVVGGGGVNLEILFRDPVKTESESIFAQASFALTDRFGLTTAVRYTDDLKRFTFNRWDFNGDPHPVLGALVDFTREYSGDQTDYRMVLDYLLTDNVMIYGQTSTGYKGGGINPRPFFTTQVQPYQPETLDAFEVGIKTQLLNDRLRFNAAVFSNTYDDLQLTLLSCDEFSPFPGAPCTQSANVGDADIEGVEVELEYAPTDRLRIDASIGVLDFQYTRVDPRTGVTLDMTTIYTPDEKYSLGIQYAIPLPRGGSLTPRIDYSYRSEIYTDAINSPATLVDDVGLVNLRVQWASADEMWIASLVGTNLTDEFYYESQFGRAFPPWLAATGRPGWPREWYLTLRRSF